MSTNAPDGILGIKVFELQTSVGNKNGEPKTTRLTKSDENCKQEYLNFSTPVSPTMGEPLRSDPQLTLIGHSIAFSEYPCSEPYSWGSSPANVQPWSDVQDLNHPRMALPLQIAEEPVYVNAKQYHGILRRRQLRAKAELENKVSKVKKVGSSRVPYLHESRHLHALRRARGCGGRFLSSKKNATSNSNNATSERGTNLNAGVSADGHISMCSHDSTFPRSSSGNVDFSGGCEELQGEYKTRMFSNGVITINGIPSSFHL